ncbi:MAG: glycosyltransferase family 2 protein [Clostridia bacterium]|nr:glycosyltransferase family 2 protein [Clostridia bacterium]
MENKKRLVSIIIPAYNAEKYLQRCLESVVNQTYKNIEIIIVNDGSTDNTESIIIRYQKKYKSIKYFKKENNGVSDARNYGIAQASGEYFCFVDADDYVSESLISDLERYMDAEHDLIKYKFSTTNADYERIDNCSGPIFDEKNRRRCF